MNGAQWVAKELAAHGIEVLFVLCGNGTAPLLDALIDTDIRVVDVRNEQAASYMADAWGAMTGRLGVILVSSGPGHTNALSGLVNAAFDGRPMLLLSGKSAQSGEGADAFQEFDQVSMVRPVCKYACQVHHVEALPQIFDTALAAATSGRPGPVHLTIPLDVLTAEVRVVAEAPPPPAARVRPHGLADPALIHEAADLLASAQRPFLLVGSGAFYAHAWLPLRRLVTLCDIPVLSHIWDRGCIEEVIPQYVGITRGGQITNTALPRLAEADVVFVVGARIDYRVGMGRPPVWPAAARVVRIDADPAEIGRGRPPELGIVGDPAAVLGQITDEIERRASISHAEWLADVRASRQLLLDRWATRAREDVWPLPALRICREIQPFLAREITFLIDGGNIGQWAHMSLFDRHPGHWLTCGASGAVGWGLGGAIAAKMARPEYPLLLLSGDGSFGFNLSEIETALRFKTPFVAIVAHDAAWGIVAEGQPEGRRVASHLGEIRFDRVAEALGARGVFIGHAAQLGPAIEEGLAADTVTVIHVPTQLASLDTWEARYGSAAYTEERLA
ncbi:MAG: thiamine pyrophosphate-binding protein [Chloroflexi bacterium]|nr:thiamine pyrophosphate-binding protein [Chloroflexota bacterium]